MSETDLCSDPPSMIAGMLAADPPSGSAREILALLERGELDTVRAIIAARAERTAAAIAREIGE